MFRGKRVRGKGSRKPLRHTDSAGWGSVFSGWRPELQLSQAPWQPVRARLPLQQIQPVTSYEQLQQSQQVCETRSSRPLIEAGVSQTNYIQPPSTATTVGAQQPWASASGAACSVGQVQGPMNLLPPVLPNPPRSSSSRCVSTDVHQKSLPFGWMMGVLRCSCGASFCPSFGIHRCSCDNPSASAGPYVTTSQNASGTSNVMIISHCRNPQTSFQGGHSAPGAASSKSRTRGRNTQRGQPVQRAQAKQDCAQTPPVRFSGLRQTRVVTTTRNVSWPFFGRRTEQLLVSGGTVFPCVHIRPAGLIPDVHYSMVVDLVPRDPPLGSNGSTPSARYLPPLNYLTGATWMAHPWKLHLETIVHAVQAPRIGIQRMDFNLPDGEYTPVIRLFTTRAHTILTGGHPSDMIELGLRWYLIDHSFVKASLSGAEQTLLFRARRPLNSQYQQSAIQTVASPISPSSSSNNMGGVAVPRRTSAHLTADVDPPTSENHTPIGSHHSYLKTPWLLSPSEARGEHLLGSPPPTIAGSLCTPSSRSSSAVFTAGSPLSATSSVSGNSSSVFSENIGRNSSITIKNSNAPFLSEDPALVNLFNSFFPQGFFDDDHRHHQP